MSETSITIHERDRAAARQRALVDGLAALKAAPVVLLRQYFCHTGAMNSTQLCNMEQVEAWLKERERALAAYLAAGGKLEDE